MSLLSHAVASNVPERVGVNQAVVYYSIAHAPTFVTCFVTDTHHAPQPFLVTCAALLEEQIARLASMSLAGWLAALTSHQLPSWRWNGASHPGPNDKSSSYWSVSSWRARVDGIADRSHTAVTRQCRCDRVCPEIESEWKWSISSKDGPTFVSSVT